MAIPTYQEIMLPLLRFASDRQEHSVREAYDHTAAHFHVSDEERRELLPSGRQPILENRVGWAGTYLKKAGLLEAPRRAHIRITDPGIEFLKSAPQAITAKFLEQFPSFLEFTRSAADQQPQNEPNDAAEQTPQELLQSGYRKIRRDLAQELLERLKHSSPQFFEQAVIDLLVAMGYGGSRAEAGHRVGRSGDGGIDGMINEDKLGLDVIYVQAKRWENIVGSKEVRDFVGSLVGRSATKGVFITTSGFTRDADSYVKSVPHRVILIDGDHLAELMIDHDIGVSGVESYEIKRVDEDYFIE